MELLLFAAFIVCTCNLHSHCSPFIFVDHYYAFEITFTQPKRVFEELLPEKYFPIYHWINTGERIVMYIIVCCISWGHLYYLLFYISLFCFSFFARGEP